MHNTNYSFIKGFFVDEDLILMITLISKLGMPKSLQKVSEMTGKSIKFFDVDICDKTKLRKVFSNNKIDCVLHIAALKSVSESFESPLKVRKFQNEMVCSIFQKNNENFSIISVLASKKCLNQKYNGTLLC